MLEKLEFQRVVEETLRVKRVTRVMSLYRQPRVSLQEPQMREPRKTHIQRQHHRQHEPMAAYPSSRWAMNCNHFPMAMLAYNLNCWLMLFNREEKVRTEELKHTTLATSRLRFLFVAAEIWRHGGRVGLSYSDHYAEPGLFQRLMERLRGIRCGEKGYAPVLAVALRC